MALSDAVEQVISERDDTVSDDSDEHRGAPLI